MKLLIHMNMPSGKNDGTHQLILDVPEIRTLEDLPYHLAGGILRGDHLIYERIGVDARTWSSRGPMIVNWAHVGKVAEYYEGKS